MYQQRNVLDNVFYLGSSDRRLNLFENAFPVPNGVSYNSYLVVDEKTVLLDMVDKSVSKAFFENLEHALGDKKLDYVVINHMEPDHTATLEELVYRYPEVTIVGNAKTFTFIKQFFTFDITNKTLEVKEGATLSSGQHTFSFYMAPMVHWPEVMVTYEHEHKILFSADAFGTFGALSGNIFADEYDYKTEWPAEARRYYSNIVGKYGPQTLALLKKAANLDIDYICPLHGPIWREKEGISWIIDKYSHWAGYIPESDDVVIFYGSIYGGTEDASNHLAAELAKRGAKNIKMYDVSTIDPSYMLAEAFRAKKLVFAASTYNLDIFPKMEILIDDLIAHGLQNRIVALMENGTWAITANKKMKELISGMKNMTILEETVSIKSSLKAEQMPEIGKLAQAIVDAN